MVKICHPSAVKNVALTGQISKIWRDFTCQVIHVSVTPLGDQRLKSPDLPVARHVLTTTGTRRASNTNFAYPTANINNPNGTVTWKWFSTNQKNPIALLVCKVDYSSLVQTCEDLAGTELPEIFYQLHTAPFWIYIYIYSIAQQNEFR